MSFFKNLFGGNNNNQKSNKPDIDMLLSSPDTNKAIIELDNYVCDLCNYGDELDMLTEPQKFFFFNQTIEREVNNGGFSLFFCNSSGNYAHETILSLKAIGAYHTADILKEAIDQFPDSTVPKNEESCKEILEKIDGVANEVWEQLDQKFYQYPDDLNSLNLAFIKENRSLF